MFLSRRSRVPEAEPVDDSQEDAGLQLAVEALRREEQQLKQRETGEAGAQQQGQQEEQQQEAQEHS
jgi:hypothetical protein